MHNRRYKLRNGVVVEVVPGQDRRHAVGVVYEGRIETLLYPPYEEWEDKPLPKGGVLGEAFDAVYLMPEDEFWEEYPRGEEQATNLLDALRYAAGFATTTQLGAIDLMATNENAFTTINFYHGAPVDNLSDDQVFGFVRNIDAKLKELAGLGDGKAVTAHRERLEAEKEGLLATVDSRYEEDAAE